MRVGFSRPNSAPTREGKNEPSLPATKRAASVEASDGHALTPNPTTRHLSFAEVMAERSRGRARSAHAYRSRPSGGDVSQTATAPTRNAPAAMNETVAASAERPASSMSARASAPHSGVH